jgi:hypothetical protein
MKLRMFAGAAFVAFVALTVGLLLSAAPLAAQGVTTAAVSGTVSDPNEDPVIGINVTVLNEATGFQTGGATNEEGRYFVSGLAVGGPYTISTTGLGFADQSRGGYNLTIGQRLVVDFVLRPEAIQMAGIEARITADQIINPDRTGQETLVTENQIDNLPTITRNFTDFIQLSPISGAGGQSSSIGQQNNRFNSIQIDGVVTQDLFGLGATGQPGGQADARSISIEAVKEYQIIAAPFDVRQSGFTGGLVNAVTKTGSNEWQASAYGYFRNDNFVREKLEIRGQDVRFGDFDNRVLGATVSGPIVEDRAHFFASFETEGDQRPGGDVAIGVNPDQATHLSAADAARVAARLQALGVDPGGFGSFTDENPNRNLFGRVDAQLNPNHILTVRHNYVRAEDDVIQNRSGGGFYSFDSNFYFFESTTNSFVTQLTSTFGQSAFNELTFGYNRIQDRRTPRVRYPELVITNIPDADLSGTVTAQVGGEEFSQANELDQDSWEITNNLSFDMGDHRITLGIQDQVFKFRNLFLGTATGEWTFSNLANFEAGVPSVFRRSILLEGVPDANARFTVNNFSLYGQTEWRGIDNVVVTGGLRYDVPFILDDPIANPDLQGVVFPAVGDERRTDEMPSGNGVLSPRLGFNWDVGGEGITQVRGGVGLFTGRQPFVWLSNLYSNTGLFSVTLNCTGAFLPPFTIDPAAQPDACVGSDPSPPNVAINLIDPDFEFPNAWRFDVGVDRELPWNIVGTAELLYTKSRKQIFLRELNVDFENPVSIGQGGRPIFGTHQPGPRGTTGQNNIARPNRILTQFPAIRQIVELGNSDEDNSWSLILQGQKRYSDGFELNASYTLSDAEDISGLTSSIATSNIGFNPIGLTSPNDPPLAISDYRTRHKLSLGATWDPLTWLTWSIGYSANAGDRYSYVYDGDVNADGYEAPTANDRQNDLLYVPIDANDVTLQNAADWARLDQYIRQEPCLSQNRGRILERNVCEEPWRHRVDTRFTFKVPTISGHHGEVVFDIFNVLNFMNKDWGLNRGVEFATIELLRMEGWDAANNRPILVLDTVNFDNKGTPDDPSDDEADPWTTFNTSSRWQAQIGVRYEVN